MERPGDSLKALCADATDRVVLAAPFAKRAVVERLLGVIDDRVAVDVVVRWLPYDIKAGVSDLEVWEVVRARPGARLFMRQDLHAKYYRSAADCLVGSANLTAAALGWSPAPNLELLVPMPRSSVDPFEEELFGSVVEVDDDVAAVIRAAVDLLPDFVAVEVPDVPPSAGPPVTIGTWIPTLRQPEELFVAYHGDPDALSGAARESAVRDLQVLRVPPGLSEPQFRACVGATLLGMPVVGAVDRFVVQPRRFGEVRDLLREQLGSEEPPERQWQVLFRWLTYFLAERFEYRRPRHSEVIARRTANA